MSEGESTVLGTTSAAETAPPLTLPEKPAPISRQPSTLSNRTLPSVVADVVAPTGIAGDSNNNNKASPGGPSGVVVPPTLADLCVSTIVRSFADKPNNFITSALPLKYKSRIVQLLPVDLDLAIATRYLSGSGGNGGADSNLGGPQERYWQRRSAASFAAVADLSRHGNSWKRNFFEEKVRDELERFTVSMELEELLAVLAVSQEHVYELRISQLPSHLDLGILFTSLPRLRSLHLSYGARELGTEYEYAAFGMRDADCASLRAALAASADPDAALPAARLERLALTNTLLDDAKLQAIAPGLAACTTLRHLDLSHNLIGDAGVRSLADALSQLGAVSLESLNLGNNALTEQCGEDLARLLSSHQRLRELSLALNELRSAGVQAMAPGIRGHASLQRLTLSSCSVGNAAVETLVPLLRQQNESLTHIDLSGNEIDDSHGKQLASLVSGNGKLRNMQQIDLRRNAACSEATLRDASGRR